MIARLQRPRRCVPAERIGRYRGSREAVPARRRDGHAACAGRPVRARRRPPAVDRPRRRPGAGRRALGAARRARRGAGLGRRAAGTTGRPRRLARVAVDRGRGRRAGRGPRRAGAAGGDLAAHPPLLRAVRHGVDRRAGRARPPLSLLRAVRADATLAGRAGGRAARRRSPAGPAQSRADRPVGAGRGLRGGRRVAGGGRRAGGGGGGRAGGRRAHLLRQPAVGDVRAGCRARGFPRAQPRPRGRADAGRHRAGRGALVPAGRAPGRTCRPRTRSRAG